VYNKMSYRECTPFKTVSGGIYVRKFLILLLIMLMSVTLAFAAATSVPSTRIETDVGVVMANSIVPAGLPGLVVLSRQAPLFDNTYTITFDGTMARAAGFQLAISISVILLAFAAMSMFLWNPYYADGGMQYSLRFPLTDKGRSRYHSRDRPV